MPIDDFDGLVATWHRVALLSRGEATPADIGAWRAGFG